MNDGFVTRMEHGKLYLPVEFRQNGKMVLTRGFDSTLYLYYANDWEPFEKYIQYLNVDAKTAHKYERFFLGAAVDIEIEGDYIEIPNYHCSYLGIENETAMLLVTWDDKGEYDHYVIKVVKE